MAAAEVVTPDRLEELTWNQRRKRIEELIGPRGGLPRLKAELQELCVLCNVDLTEEMTVANLTEKLKPVIAAFKGTGEMPPTRVELAQAKAKAVAAKSSAARPRPEPKAVAIPVLQGTPVNLQPLPSDHRMQLKVPQPDAEDEDDATIEEVREAQALTGALLWLSTRCRPELSFPVHVMAKHAVKKPKMTIANGHSIIKYLQSQRGGLIYAGADWNGEWGPRQQLMAKRHNYLMEVYSDVSYASAPGWKSTSGVAVYVAGAIIAWMTTSQPFVTQSTAEAELVGLSEANLCGQSVQSLLEVMLELDDNRKNLEVIMYGDNSASIGMVSGSSSASWRTRHLRIRAACLRQSLEAKGWLLRHLRGTELVADGMTKQLSGQPWERFLEDLGGVRGAVSTTSTTSTTSTGTSSSIRNLEQITGEKTVAREIQQHLAMKAMAIGGLLIASSSETQDENTAWVGAQLMAVGWRSLQEASNHREVGSTSGECLGGVVEEQFMEKPVLRVMRERSRTTNDRDRDQPPQGERLESMDSQASTENAGGEASGSAGVNAEPTGEAVNAAATGMTSEERTRRNEEMADLTSESNVAVFGRDSGIVNDTVMMEDEEWSVHSGREVEFDLQEGDEDPRIAIEALLERERPPEENERRRRQALERRRDQAVEEAIRRLGIPDPGRSGVEQPQQDQTPDDPNVVAEVLNPEGVENPNPEGAEAANPEGEEEESQETPLSELLDRMVDREDEPQAFLVIRDTKTNINGSWLLRPTARRTILTYLMKYPKEESDEGTDLASLRAIRDDMAAEEEQMRESILTNNVGMRKVLRSMGFNVAEPGEGEEEENRDTDEDHDEPMRELTTPTEETFDPERESKVKPRKAMLFDGPEQPTGPETPEERKPRLVRESLIAHARMQVFKTHYNRNKKAYLEMRGELGEDADGQNMFEFETFDDQGNAHVVEVDEECDYSPTSAGGEVPGPVGPTPPSEPEETEMRDPNPPSEPTGSEGSEGKGGQKGKSHRTWGSLTPERMRKEDFKSLKHPWAPWPKFIEDEEEDRATSTTGPTTGQAVEKEAKELEPDQLPAVPKGADPQWWKPGAFFQNFVLLEDVEARRPSKEEEDGQPFTEEQWNELSPWRRERIVEWMRQKGKGKGKPRYPNEPKGPHEPGGGGSSGGGASSSSVAVRAMRVPTDSEWEMISGSSQRGTPEQGEGRQDGLQTEGEMPGLGQGQGERPGLRHGEDPELPQGEGPWGAQGQGGRWVFRGQGQGLEWQEDHPELPEGDRRGLERGYQAEQGEGRFEGPFHFGGEHAPVPLVQQLSTSSGLPSHSSQAPTPMFGSSGTNWTSQRTSHTSRTASTTGVETTLGRDRPSTEGASMESGATRRETVRSTESDETAVKTKVTTVVEVAKPAVGTTSRPASSSLDLRQRSGLSASSGTTSGRSGSASREEPTVVEVSTTVSVTSGGEKVVRQMRKSSKMPVDGAGEAILEGDVDCFGNPIPEEESTLEHPEGVVVGSGYSAYQVPPLTRKPRRRKKKESTAEAEEEAEEVMRQNVLGGLRDAVRPSPGTTSLPASSTSVATAAAASAGIDHGRGDRQDARHGEILPTETFNDNTRPPANPWNAFQHANRGRGWSKQRMQEEYWSQKGRGKSGKSGKP